MPVECWGLTSAKSKSGNSFFPTVVIPNKKKKKKKEQGVEKTERKP